MVTELGKNKLIIIIGLLVCALDQLSKYAIKAHLKDIGQAAIAKPVLYFTLVANTGASFGMFKGYNFVLIIISFIALAYIVWIAGKEKLPRAPKIFVGFVLGGLLGNLIDRIVLACDRFH